MGYPAYGHSGYMTPEQIEAQRQAIEQAKKESHDEALEGHEKEIAAYQEDSARFHLKTDFTQHDIDQLKAMIENANPGGVEQIGSHWKRVHDQLVGEGGGAPSGNSAYGQLKKAVDDVLEHWEGESADQFKTKANKILQQIANSASHATTVSHVMKRAAQDLRTQQNEIAKIEKPSWFGKAWDAITDSGRDDKYTEQDIKNGNLPKDLIAEANEGYIGAEKEEQLKAVAIMETLGRNYVQYGRRLKVDVDDGKQDIPPSSPEAAMPTPIPAASGSSPAPSAGSRASTSSRLAGTSKAPAEVSVPRDPGISGGQQVPASQTKVDSLPSGISGGGTSSAPGSGAVPGGGGTGATGNAGAGTVPGGGLAAGGAAAAAGARGAAGRAGIGGAGGRAGIGGTGGMGGRGGGAAAGGARGAAGAVGRGALAKVKGGVAGAPQGISGGRPATPGGTGLGKGRTGAGGATGPGAGGMLAGGARGSNQRPGDKEGDQGERPDYLVEDEETWTPEDGRSVPKTIE